MQRKENLKFNAELQFGAIKVSDIPCEVFFPEMQDGKVLLEVQIKTNSFPGLEIPFVFSLRASFSRAQNILLEVSADKIYKSGVETFYVATNQEYSILRAEPVDLKIREFFQASEENKNGKHFYFWLTQSEHLSPFSSSFLDCNGNITVEAHDSKNFEIAKGVKLKFSNYYFYYDDPKKKNRRISESVLAAESLDCTEYELGENIFPEIEAFLKLVSLSERRRIVCYGYRGVLDGEMVDFYRGDISIPEQSSQSSNDPLIDLQDFPEFIFKVLKMSKDCNFREYLFDAIGKVACREYASIESEFLSYYSALENLVNGYGKSQESHKILDDESYSIFCKNLKEFIKQHVLFGKSNDTVENRLRSKKRELMYEKIAELNRASFGKSFELFCEFYEVNLSDLWPLRGGGSSFASLTLTQIRNHLIHGERFEREEYEALICANDHLRWMLERCILRVLDWDVERSAVRPLYLKKYHINYTEWHEKKSLLKI
jgi:hypothetical protein